MKITRRHIIQWAGSALLTGAVSKQLRVEAQDSNALSYRDAQSLINPSLAVLELITPNEYDLQGFLRQNFSRTQPAGSIFSSSPDKYGAQPISDTVSTDVDLDREPFGRLRQGRVSSLQRVMISSDTFYQVRYEVHICDSLATAQGYIIEATHMTQAAWQKGTLRNAAPIADESWVIDGSGNDFKPIWFRFGKVVARVDGRATGAGQAYGMTLSVPASVVEAIAHLIILRIARLQTLSSRINRFDKVNSPRSDDLSVSVQVNGETLPKHSCQLVGDQVYVPVLTFADAASLQARWVADVGALMLVHSPFAAMTLAAGSDIVKEGPPTKATIKVPLFKDGSRPIMALADLLSLLPRSSVQQEDGIFRVTV